MALKIHTGSKIYNITKLFCK